MTNIDEKIAELKELMAKATPAPWKVDSGEALNIRAPHQGILAQLHWLKGPHGLKGRIDSNENHANAALIVAMHNYLPELIAEYKEALEAYFRVTEERNKEYARADQMQAERDVLAKKLPQIILELVRANGGTISSADLWTSEQWIEFAKQAVIKRGEE